jgi:2-keto-4-pentenoate hydratase/2-oxohepta-3-ene-1,7-dioic acid hydratase in catechol pathway
MKIFCVGRNYAEHAKELNNQVPDKPVVFMKPPTALIKGTEFYIPDWTHDLHHEIELVVKICRNGKGIQEEFAHKYYEELALGIDFTARDLQTELKNKGLPWELAKAFDNSALCSDFFKKEELAINNLNFSLKKNHEMVQSGNASSMIFSIDKLIAFLSTYFTLQKGDLIYTGTPSGVGKVTKGDLLTGYLEAKEVFHLNIK